MIGSERASRASRRLALCLAFGSMLLAPELQGGNSVGVGDRYASCLNSEVSFFRLTHVSVYTLIFLEGLGVFLESCVYAIEDCYTSESSTPAIAFIHAQERACCAMLLCLYAVLSSSCSFTSSQANCSQTLTSKLGVLCGNDSNRPFRPRTAAILLNAMRAITGNYLAPRTESPSPLLTQHDHAQKIFLRWGGCMTWCWTTWLASSQVNVDILISVVRGKHSDVRIM